MSVRPSVHPSDRRSIRLSVHPSVGPPVSPSARPSVGPSVRLSVTPSLRPLLGASYAEYSALLNYCSYPTGMNLTCLGFCLRQGLPNQIFHHENVMAHLLAAALLSQGELSDSSAEHRFSGSSVSIRSINASAISGMYGPYSSRTRRRYCFFGLTENGS